MAGVGPGLDDITTLQIGREPVNESFADDRTGRYRFGQCEKEQPALGRMNWLCRSHDCRVFVVRKRQRLRHGWPRATDRPRPYGPTPPQGRPVAAFWPARPWWDGGRAGREGQPASRAHAPNQGRGAGPKSQRGPFPERGAAAVLAPVSLRRAKCYG